jgi:hypothetical protein
MRGTIRRVRRLLAYNPKRKKNYKLPEKPKKKK